MVIIGIDEAGRGPLAGPVVVGGIRINSKFKFQKSKFWKDFKNIKDSKKLSARQREAWFSKLTAHREILWAVARVYPKTIDRINISQAANLGARRVYKKLAGNRLLRTVLDGGLYLPKQIPSQTIVKGDEKIPAIAAASIIAKVTRDRLMLRLHKKYPQYRFDIHKGYGTALHRALIKKYGRSKAHRESFHSREIS
ncbi:ribonuclease HII [Patescibacteria group bacterium]|nr:ribonuclease HII [Patescibacteria group bacterium]